jgi:hypothetical protein
VALTKNLSFEKKALMRNSIFNDFLETGNGSERSAVLVSLFCDVYQPTKKIFVFNNDVSFSFCLKEVAHVFGIEDIGTGLAYSPAAKFPQLLFDLKREFNFPEPKI